MNKLKALVKIQLIDFFSRYAQQLNMRSRIWQKLIIFLPLLIFMPAVILIQTVYQSFLAIGHPELTLTYVYVATTTLVFIAAIPLIVSVFFYAKDLGLIATLPVEEETLIYAKLSSVYIYLLGLSAFLYGTAVSFYAFGDGFKPFSLLMGLVTLLLTPLMPMIFATLIILPFMTYIGSRKKRSSMVIVGNLLLLTAIIGIQSLMTRVQMDPASVQKILSSDSGLLWLVGHKFPPSVWLTQMVMGSLVATASYIALNMAWILLLKLSAKSLYRGAMQKYNQQNTFQGVKGPLTYKPSSKMLLLIKRHLGIIYHNPTFLLNTIMTLFVPVLLFVVYLATGIMKVETFRDPNLAPFLLYIYAGVISAPSLMGSLSATVISREGKSFWETRVLPISVQENLKARILSTILISGAASALLAVLSLLIIPIHALDAILAVIFCIAMTCAMSTMDLIINIKRPFLNWSSPTAAVKNNLNMMIAFLPRLAVIGIGWIIVLVLPNPSPQAIMALGSVVMAVLFVIVRKAVYSHYAKSFIDMEV